nr:hypothetical protein BgiMline_020647 [Biomphalaria glabrata]
MYYSISAPHYAVFDYSICSHEYAVFCERISLIMGVYFLYIVLILPLVAPGLQDYFHVCRFVLETILDRDVNVVEQLSPLNRKYTTLNYDLCVLLLTSFSKLSDSHAVGNTVL